MIIAVPIEKMSERGRGQYRFVQILCLLANHNLLALHGYEKKFRPKLRVKTKEKVFTLNLSLISQILSRKTNGL